MATTTLVQALAKAQSEMSHAELDSTNPQFNSKFSSLKAVIDAVKEPLNDNGIAFVQKSYHVDNGVSIETVFYGHGEEISTGAVTVPAQKATPQGYGSALTYAKRYSLAMACGISAAEDDDAESAEAETKLDFSDLEAPVAKPAKVKASKPTKAEESKTVVDHDPQTEEEAVIAVDGLVAVVRGMCESVDEAKDVFKANDALVKNLEEKFPEQRKRLSNAMGIFVKQLAEKQQ